MERLEVLERLAALSADLSPVRRPADFDSANDGNGVPPLRTLYTTTRPFPADPDDPLDVNLNWVDVHDATTIVARWAARIRRSTTLDPRARGSATRRRSHSSPQAAMNGSSSSPTTMAGDSDACS